MDRQWGIWSSSQQKVVTAILLCLLCWWGYKTFSNRSIIAYPQAGPGPRALELEDRLDPNSASAAELAALPVIGNRVANQIVAYREEYQRDNRGDVAFKTPDDLLKIHGIGFNVLEQIEPYLKFPTTRAPSTHDRLK